MEIKDLVLKNRSYRKFHANQKVGVDTLRQLVDLARTTPSSKNKQPLKYLLVHEQQDADFVFDQLRWAWYLKDWNGPAVDERPPAYIVVVLDTELNDNALIDVGIASQTILLGAVEKQMGGCIIRTVNTYAISRHFKLPSHYEVVQVLALGYPMQEVCMTDISADESIEYFTNKQGHHCVPKRSLDDIII